MNDTYQYSGKRLTVSMAQELIQELFTGETVALQEIRERVDAAHTERGGLLSNYKRSHPVSDALSKMKRLGLAENPLLGVWSILSEGSSESEDLSQSGEPDPITSLNKFMNWIEELPQGEYVYRGVSNKDYQIEASTYRRLKDENGKLRDEDKTAERLLQVNQEMIEDANRHRHGWENGLPPSNLNLLAKLQHSGAATLLIDFTKNPLVALWMACRKSGKGSVDGRVYAVEIGSRSPFQPISADEAKNDINHFFQADDKTGYKLYQWQPHYQDNRMLAQQSVFLFGGGRDAIEPSKKCVISQKHKGEIWDSLKKSAGISEDILFPDFEGFASQRAQNKAYNQSDVPVDKDPILALPGSTADETIGAKEQNQSSAAHHLQLSLQAYREGNTEVALQHYNMGMEFEPSDELLNNFYRERAIINHNNGYFNTAISDCDQAVSFNPNDGESYYWRGRVKSVMQRFTEAIADFEHAIGINSDIDHYYYWRGLAEYSLQQYPEAILDFNRAISLNPNDTYFYHWRGMATLNLEDPQEAIGYFNQAISRDPNNAYSYHYRALAQNSLNQYPAAIADYDRSIELNPTNTFLNGYSYYNRGLTKKQMGLLNAAQADFRVALMCAEEIENHDLIALIRQEL